MSARCSTLPSPRPRPAATHLVGNEPLVIGGCTVQFDQRQQVSAEVDGKIELIAVRDDDINPTDPLCVYHPRDVNKQVKYRKLRGRHEGEGGLRHRDDGRPDRDNPHGVGDRRRETPPGKC